MIDYQRTPIEYDLLATAKNHYVSRGYTHMEVPWVVSSKVYNITLPRNMRSKWFGRHPVASGEQGFLEYWPGSNRYYQTTTPCFRPNDPVDGTHSTQFMKLELFYHDSCGTLSSHGSALNKMLIDACDLYKRLLPNADVQVELVSDEPRKGCVSWTQYDIVSKAKGIELGSYGVRSILAGSGLNYWVYGTGLALPRLHLGGTVQQ